MTQLYAEIINAVLFGIVLIVFTIGKSPVFRVDRAGAAIIGAAAMMGFGILSFDQAIKAIDHRTIVILFSMMVIVANLKTAGFFEQTGQIILQNVHSRKALLGTVIFISGFVSAFAINDIVCLLFTPVVLFICNKAGCPPIPHLLGLAMASNVGSALTFLGNPQNILIGSLSKLSFFTYLKTASLISVVGLVLIYILICHKYKSELTGTLENFTQNEIYFHPYLTIKTLATLALVLLFYIAGFDIAILSSLGAAFLLITRRVKPNKIYTSIDFNLLIIFIGLFIIVGGIEASGLLTKLNTYLPEAFMQNLNFFAFISVFLSNIVSNVPAVLLLQYYIQPEDASLKWQALALFTTFAGNLTIFGSIANLIVVEIAKKHHVQINAREYFRIGFPLTLLLSLLCLLWLHLLQAASFI
ncbi:ArsB/NhaD family transporter [Anaerosinus massiliensis]|uniref:SLC13 family permease n=1 Tax=Massilibacillus massiliensis TaxID=1806837 RepID=UPI000AD1133C|nr:SLC13 family permease [Massilibacillus massiliensis]